jgi:hypothetical protein
VIQKKGMSTDEIQDWTTPKDADLFTKFYKSG